MSEDAEIKQILGIVQDLHESIQFMQENMATKQELAALRTETKQDLADIRNEMATKQDLVQIRHEMATKKDLEDVKSELLEHIDGFAQQNQKFDQELVAAQAKFNRVEDRVETLELEVGIGA